MYLNSLKQRLYVCKLLLPAVSALDPELFIEGKPIKIIKETKFLGLTSFSKGGGHLYRKLV